MLKLVFLILVFITSTTVLGQRYDTKYILKKADSLIVSVVGQSLVENHYQLDSTSYFETKTTFNVNKIKHLTNTKRTNGKIRLISVRYAFYLKKFEQPFVWTSIIFNKDLNIEKPVDTTFIPQYILNGTENDFLTKDSVLEIGKLKFAKKAIKPIEASLAYDAYKKFYVWTVLNIVNEWKGYKGEVSRDVELLEIDASNGKIITFYPNALQGHIH